jgi:hypothetical protein
MPYDPAFDISTTFTTTSTANTTANGGRSGIQLPADLNNILASIQQQSIATGGQSLQANSQVMGNVQSILANIMVRLFLNYYCKLCTFIALNLAFSL